MTRKSFGLLFTAVVCATTMSISISSCDNNNSPTTPGNGGINRGKGPEVLGDEGRKLVEISEVPLGKTSFNYNEDGDLVVEGLDGNPKNGVGCGFAVPINVWHADIDAKFPSSEGSFSIDATDDKGNVEAAVTIKDDGTGYVAFPTFTSHPDGGKPQYDVYIYDNGTLTGKQLNVSAADVIRIDNRKAACTLNVTRAGWDVFKVDAQCIWKIKLNPCCTFQFKLPDGTVFTGNEFKFVEKNEKGVYVYLETRTVRVTGRLSSYAVSSASAYSAQR